MDVSWESRNGFIRREPVIVSPAVASLSFNITISRLSYLIRGNPGGRSQNQRSLKLFLDKLKQTIYLLTYAWILPVRAATMACEKSCGEAVESPVGRLG